MNQKKRPSELQAELFTTIKDNDWNKFASILEVMRFGDESFLNKNVLKNDTVVAD
jgi:hypothetical protein